MDKMGVREARRHARELIMEQISLIGYGERYEQFCGKFDSVQDAEKILKEEMDRVARLFGMDKAYFG